MSIELTSIQTFAGPLWIAESARGVCRVGFGFELAQMPSGWRHTPGKSSRAVIQLDEYFAGARQHFDLTLDLQGTAFQQRVWALLQTIDYGTTTSYGQLAKTLGKPGASRAVGSANANNPIAIVVPCHRVIASNGGLAGFAWGTDTKRGLLDLEQRVIGCAQPVS